jgi:hypothetical protein
VYSIVCSCYTRSFERLRDSQKIFNTYEPILFEDLPLLCPKCVLLFNMLARLYSQDRQASDDWGRGRGRREGEGGSSMLQFLRFPLEWPRLEKAGRARKEE